VVFFFLFFFIIGSKFISILINSVFFNNNLCQVGRCFAKEKSLYQCLVVVVFFFFFPSFFFDISAFNLFPFVI
jgi:hypothetical protein